MNAYIYMAIGTAAVLGVVFLVAIIQYCYKKRQERIMM